MTKKFNANFTLHFLSIYKDAVKLQKIMQIKAQELLDLGHQVCII